MHHDGSINHRAGGLISDADAFDNDFFGITPREAEAMDPQQRLLLQTAWRALENATLDPRGQAGSNTGVFVGVMANEWAHLHMSDYREITAQDGSGNGYFMTANRLSYQLDFKGPSLAVDTACSSSLVAVHLAAQALRNAECDQAVAAGVNLTLTPALNVFYTKAGLAAPDGRCKPFSGKADGIGRGEGVAVVVLRRLEDAVAAGLPIYAVIKGSAVNSDGRSNGITAPNRWAQQQVAASACQSAGIAPEQINFLEAHGTGTLLGDMIEAKALAHAHRSRRDTPCAIGSIKGNLGHTEGAAGIAGLIKVVLSLHHRVVPPSRFADTENEQLRLADGGLRMLSEPMELPAETVHAGVSSFGIGGTNCHMVLASAPAAEPAPTATGARVSSPYRQTLQRVCAATLYSWPIDIENSDAPLAQLCWSTNRIKASGKARLAIVAGDRAEAVAALRGDFEIGHRCGNVDGLAVQRPRHAVPRHGDGAVREQRGVPRRVRRGRRGDGAAPRCANPRGHGRRTHQPHRVRPARDLRAAVCAGTGTAFGSVPNRPGCSGTASASTPRPPSPRCSASTTPAGWSSPAAVSCSSCLPAAACSRSVRLPTTSPASRSISPR